MLLVTTSLKDTLDIKKKIFFLGEWCFNTKEKNSLPKTKYHVLTYHWNDQKKRNNNYFFLEKIYEEYLKNISLSLNKIHNLNKSNDYWRIIIGPWLRFFIDSIFDRYESIKNITVNKKIKETIVCNYKIEDFTPDNFDIFYKNFVKDEWNHIVFAEFLKTSSIKCIFINQKLFQVDSSPQKFMNFLITKAYNIFFYISYYLNSYNFSEINIPKFKKILISIKLNLFPNFNFYTPGLKKKNLNKDLRALIKFKKTNDNFKIFLNKFIRIWMPKIYLEDFAINRDFLVKKFSRNPKIIFTQTGYQFNDLFKIWCAEKKEQKKAIFIIGQHGGNMGISKQSQSEDHQLKIANYFLSWGWSRKGFDNIRKISSLTLSTNLIKTKSNRKIILLPGSYPRYFYCNYSVPIAGQAMSYFEDQIKLFQQLKKNLKKNIFIRLNGNDIDQLNIIKREKLDKFIVSNRKNFDKEISKYNMCLVTYNSTVMLETLAANFPTIIILDPRYFQIRNEAKNKLKKLHEVGVLHYSYESAIDLTLKVESSINQWWANNKLQNAVKEFCSFYACSSSNFAVEWKARLKSFENEIKI
jgi:putative transferase (TIGR04331 family)